jgi:hypothetical protein
MYDYVVGFVMIVALVAILGKWRIGREVVMSTLRHPLKTSVIHVSESANKKQIVAVQIVKEPKVIRASEEEHPRSRVAAG